MPRVHLRLALACGVAAGLLGTAASAQNPTIYRYLDGSGQIIYSDHLPPANAKNVEEKKLNQNYIETDKLSTAAQRAQSRNPVTLYTFDCGETCDRAEGLLNRRGVPFSRVDVKDSAGAAKLKQITGDMQVPVLQAGDKLISKGFSDTIWQALLDDAGYPKAPASRIATPKPAADAGKAAPAAPAPPAKPAAAAEAHGYPKN